MNLRKYNGSIKWWELFWATMIALCIIGVLAWVSMGVWYANHQPQLSGIEKARKAFIDNCSGSRAINGWTTQYQSLVPTAAGDDASKWKCEAK